MPLGPRDDAVAIAIHGAEAHLILRRRRRRQQQRACQHRSRQHDPA
ncbi:MAG: hypothetical protein MZV64_42645 [Ignavibacteriales bacterium]|nr:hypothetical protein [Ignavibacteriales bacterium]